MNDDRHEFLEQRRHQILAMSKNAATHSAAHDLFLTTVEAKYSYHFDWCGLPIIQYPQDIVALQEIIWKVRPKWIVETGVARGGSLALSASMLELIGDGHVIGIDIDIRAHNRKAIEDHRLAKRITLIQGSSVDAAVVEQVQKLVGGQDPVLVLLDSNHTHQHVLDELQLYSPLVRAGSYIVVYDTVIEDMPARFSDNRAWGPGNSPKTAVHAFLAKSDRFKIDREIENKLLLTVCPDGFLQCVKAP